MVQYPVVEEEEAIARKCGLDMKDRSGFFAAIYFYTPI
jgi:hypothetical protein